ncbi:hypothetical protein [Streptomyces sp. NRRL F-5053]|uniref:hypothetical protein n=1 Tax=Streptomyces sp. NRRL F-5053 TaxID=1463854 RepID=UPI0004CA07DC|nr:hypothetical protein [Streptomyces sp. NRRL F-5053]
MAGRRDVDGWIPVVPVDPVVPVVLVGPVIPVVLRHRPGGPGPDGPTRWAGGPAAVRIAGAVRPVGRRAPRGS